MSISWRTFRVPHLSPEQRNRAAWSLSGIVASTLISLVTTRYISVAVGTSEFGRVSLVTGAIGLISNFLLLPFLTAHNRLFFEFSAKGLSSWFRKVFLVGALLVSSVGTLTYLTLAFTNKTFDQGILFALLIPAAALITTQVYLGLLMNYVEARNGQRRIALLNPLNRALYPFFLFCSGHSWVLTAPVLLFAQAGATLSILIISMSDLWIRRKLNDSAPADNATELRTLGREMLGLWALPVGNVAMWLLTTSDRYLIGHYVGVPEVGIYSMSYGLWSMPFMLLNGWLEVLTRPLIYNHASHGRWRDVRRVIAYRALVAVILSVATLGIIVSAGPLFSDRFLGPQYHVPPALIFTIAAGHCFMVLGYSVLPIFLATKRPGGSLPPTLIAAASLLLFEIVYLARLGIMAAAYATLLSYVVWSALLSLRAWRYATSLVGTDLARAGAG